MKTQEEIRKASNLLILEEQEDGGTGIIFQGTKRYGSVIWSWGGGWDHVSVHPFDKRHTPTWDEMCRFKEMFFRDDEMVVQYHPAKDQYVNNLPNCLHLWKPTKETMPTPPSIMVGYRDGQTREEIQREIAEVMKE